MLCHPDVEFRFEVSSITLSSFRLSSFRACPLRLGPFIILIGPLRPLAGVKWCLAEMRALSDGVRANLR